MHTNALTLADRPLGLIATIAHLRKSTGAYFGIYRGLGATMLYTLPFIGVNFLAYEFYMSLMARQNHRSLTVLQEPSAHVTIMCGVASVLTTQALLYPLDTIRRRHMVGLFGRLHQNRALYRGFAPMGAAVACSLSLSYLVYDQAKKRLLDSHIGMLWPSALAMKHVSVLMVVG
jgi:hypothetical protein